MQISIKHVLSGLVLSVLANQAIAGGMVTPVIEPVIVAPVIIAPVGVDWSGLYAGLSYGSSTSSGAYDDMAGNFKDATDFGLHLGYMRDMGNLVVGGELEYAMENFADSSKNSDIFRVKGRVGYDAGRLLPYAVLGFSHANLKDTNVNYSQDGLTAGLGLDYMVTDRFIIGAEYLMDRYNDVGKADGLPAGLDLDLHTVAIRATMRF